MPKRFILFKWIWYAFAVLALSLLELYVVRFFAFRGVFPFLPPMVVGAVASCEGSRASPFFALVYGLLCDLLLYAPAPGFFTLTFTLAALIAALLAENLLPPGWLCAFVCTLVCYVCTALGRVLVLVTRGGGTVPAFLVVASAELLVSLPWLLAVFPVIRTVCRRTTVEY